MTPSKHSDTDTRKKPLALGNGHDRYITATSEWTPVSVSEVKPTPGSGSGLKGPLGLVESCRCYIYFCFWKHGYELKIF
jgi:hypothetical protein